MDQGHGVHGGQGGDVAQHVVQRDPVGAAELPVLHRAVAEDQGGHVAKLPADCPVADHDAGPERRVPRVRGRLDGLVAGLGVDPGLDRLGHRSGDPRVPPPRPTGGQPVAEGWLQVGHLIAALLAPLPEEGDGAARAQQPVGEPPALGAARPLRRHELHQHRGPAHAPGGGHVHHPDPEAAPGRAPFRLVAQQRRGQVGGLVAEDPAQVQVLLPPRREPTQGGLDAARAAGLLVDLGLEALAHRRRVREVAAEGWPAPGRDIDQVLFTHGIPLGGRPAYTSQRGPHGHGQTAIRQG